MGYDGVHNSNGDAGGCGRTGMPKQDAMRSSRSNSGDVSDPTQRRIRLGDLLVQRGEISVAERDEALRIQKRTGRRLGAILIASGRLSRRRLRRHLRIQQRLLRAAMGAAMVFGISPSFSAEPAPAAAVQIAALSPDRAATGTPDADRSPYPGLRECGNDAMQEALERSLDELGLGDAAAARQLAVALVDITDPRAPRLASVNGDHMMYAASLPKIGILLGVMQRVHDGELALNDDIRAALTRMIRNSSNSAATEMYHAVGPQRLAAVLRDYGLYDPRHNGGLWVGKPYSSADAWRRDPLHGISHGATALQTARFLYLMETGRLASPELSAEMKSMLSRPAIHHKFVKGLEAARPDAVIYRKSGTWRSWHSDAALIERDGRRYIAVALANAARGSAWLSALIVRLDDIVFEQGEPLRVAAAD